MSNLTTRAGKGSPLTNNELDANFTNLNADKVEVGGDLSGTATAPNVAKIQGRAVSSDAPEAGEKLVWNGSAWEPSTDPTGEPIGHADKSESTVSFNSGTRTFTIAPVAASFTVWCKGVKHTYTSAQTVVIPDTTGLHFIYFDASGVLSTQMTYFTWDEHAPTAYIYWNATTQQAVYFGDERHGITLDWQTHEYLHRTRGAAIASGFGASGYTTTGAGATDADAQIDIGGGTFFDEDLQVDIVSTNTPVAGTWQQDLSGPARIPVLYLSGSAWVIDAPTNFPFKVVSGVPQYNLYSGGTWSTASVANNEYFVTWILATHNLTYPVIAVISQALTNQLSAAEAMTFEGLNLNGFPSVEFRPLYKVIYQYKSGFTNSIKTSTIAVYDLRSLQSAGVAAALVQDHGNLSGLIDDDHPQYLHVSTVRTPSDAVKNSFLPSQSGNSGKYLTTDGSNPSWGAIPSGSLTFTGDVTGTGNTGSSTTLTLANSGVTAGTFTKVTVDEKGRVTTGASISSSDVTTALGFTPESAANKGAANGYASLDAGGKVPSTQLPSYVDDVLEYANLAAFPVTGETGKIYIAIDTVKTYRWSGSAYVEITSSPGTTDSVTEGSTNLYFTNARARAAVSASGSLSYNVSTGIFSYTQPTNVSTFTNDSGYLTGITGTQVTTALGYTPLSTAGGTLTGGLSIGGNLNMGNFGIVGVDYLTFNDPGPNEGLTWNGGNAWRLFESPNDLTTNSGGNIQFVQNGVRRATFNTSGQLELPIATGTAPFLVSSTTRVANLNVATAGTADALTTARTINGVSFDGTANITVADSTKLPLTGGTLSGKLTTTATSDWTWQANSGANTWAIGPSTTSWGVGDSKFVFASSGTSANGELILERGTTKLLEVLQANLQYKGNVVLHAGNYNSYALPLSGGTLTGLLTLNGGVSVLSGTGGGQFRIRRNSASTTGDDVVDIHMDDSSLYFDIDNDNDGDTGYFQFRRKVDGVWTAPTAIYAGANVVFHDGYHPNADALTTARTINGVSFDGTANITIADSTKLPLTGGTINGTLVVNSTSDVQITLTSSDSWTGIGFNDGAATGTEYIWHNGANNTFAIGGGGANVAGKKLHVDGGMTIGANYDATTNPTNGLNVEGAIQQAGSQVLHAGNYSSYAIPLSGGTVTGPITIDSTGSLVYTTGAGTYIPYPQGASYRTTSSSVTGALRINLPTAAAAQSDMISFWVDVYEYASQEVCSIFVAGYARTNAGTEWNNTYANIISKTTDRDFTVRFCYDGTRHSVCIGEVNTVWAYPQVTVRDFQAGYSATSSSWDDGWAVDFVTTTPTTINAHASNFPIAKQLWGDSRQLKASSDTWSSYDAYSANTTQSALRLIDSNGGWRGTYYGGGSAQGFLNSSGGWDLQKLYNGELSLVVSGSTRTALHSGNYSSYALPLSGGTLTGNLNLNAAGTAKIAWRTAGQGTPGINAPFYTNPSFGSLVLEVSDNDTGGVVIDNEGVTVFGAGDNGTVFRVIDEDVYQSTSSVTTATTFWVNQGTSGGGGMAGTFNATTLQQSGNQVLHAGNYTSYSPSLTGSGASGTWGINISGSAAQLGGNSSSAYSGPASAVKQFFWSGLGAASTQARTYEIARLGIDYNDWNSVGPFEVELYEGYYSNGLKKKYVISYGYGGNQIQLVEYSGSGDNNFRVRIGSPVLVTGDQYYLPVYVDVRYYANCAARVTTNRSITASNPPAIGQAYINSSPSAVNISDFTADGTVNFASTTAVQINGNQLLHAGNYNSYALPLSGGTLTGELTQNGNNTWYGGSNNHRSNSEFNFLTNTGGAQSGKFRGIQVSDSYSGSVPTNGILLGTDTTLVRATTTYGSIYINGARNGYYGTMYATANGNAGWMTNGNASGYYNHSYGWKYYHESGVFKILSGTYGGGTEYTALHSGNYTSYSPSLTGSGASGTWGINITGNAATATSADQIDGVAFRNTGSNAGVNADTLASNGITYYTSGVTNFSGNSTDGALYSQVYSGDWQHQIAGDYRSGQIALRGKNLGTWQSWRTVLDSGNYTSYAVGISNNSSLNSDSRNTRGVTRLYRRDSDSDYSVQTYWTGSHWYLAGYSGDSFHADCRVAYADTAGSASTATTASNSTNLNGSAASYYDHRTYTSSNNYLGGYYVSGGTEKPNNTIFGAGKLKIAMLSGSNLGFGGSWNDVLWMSTYTGGDVKPSCAIVADKYSDELYFSRQNYDSASWGTGRRLLHSGNYTSFAPSLTGSGASGTWGINVTGYAQTLTGTANSANLYANGTGSYGTWRLDGSRGSYTGFYLGNGGGVVLGMYDSGGNGGAWDASASWHFYWHRSNACMGIGGSTTSSSYKAYVSGALYATGNITAYSDVRKKENIVTIDGALDKVSRMRGVFYNRKDDDAKVRQVGVIAQEINEVLPEAVTYATDVDEYGVAYGNIVGVLIEAIKELRAEVSELKSKLH